MSTCDDLLVAIREGQGGIEKGIGTLSSPTAPVTTTATLLSRLEHAFAEVILQHDNLIGDVDNVSLGLFFVHLVRFIILLSILLARSAWPFALAAIFLADGICSGACGDCRYTLL